MKKNDQKEIIAIEKSHKFVKFVQEELKRQNMSITEFSEKIGRTKQGISLWFLRKSKINIISYYRILEALNIKIKFKLKKTSYKEVEGSEEWLMDEFN